MSNKIFIILSLALLSCEKAQMLRSDFTVTPFVQTVKNGADSITWKASGYVFFVDSLSYFVASYEEAVAGEIRSKADSSIITADLTATITDDGTLVFNNLKKSTLFAIVYDTYAKSYAWRQITLQPGIEKVTTRVRFRLWQTKPYKESGWNVVIPIPKTSTPAEEDEEVEEEEEDS